ncbi:MAG: hypothetical protein WCW78_03305 [Candidatus Paceibacterota bacterium]|jgi:hypothetical protein
MSRSLKQFIYGALYFAIVCIVVFGIWGVTLQKPQTCFDGIQNQNETEIDCGGSCIACAIKHLKPLEEGAIPRMFSLATGKAVALFEIVNPNQGYHAAQFTYRITARDANGTRLESLEGTDTLFAGETRLIFEPRFTTYASAMKSVAIEMTNPEWRSVEELLPPVLSLHNVVTENGDTIRVSGTIKNEGALHAKEVKVVAVLVDQFGYELFAAQTILTSVDGFASVPFTIPFPADKDIASRTDMTATKVSIYSR